MRRNRRRTRQRICRGFGDRFGRDKSADGRGKDGAGAARERLADHAREGLMLIGRRDAGDGTGTIANAFDGGADWRDRRVDVCLDDKGLHQHREQRGKRKRWPAAHDGGSCLTAASAHPSHWLLHYSVLGDLQTGNGSGCDDQRRIAAELRGALPKYARLDFGDQH
jgi:hypothetical protein